MKIVIAENPAEQQDAFRVRHTVFVGEQNVPEELEMDEYDQSSLHFVVYMDEVPIGAGRLRNVDGIGKIERICVLSNYRKYGVGKVLMEKIESAAKEHGFTTLKLNSQVHAEPFYSKLGYKVVSETFMDAGIPHVTMTKTL